MLNNLKLTIPKGKVTALIGISGCGKTTALSLLERFFEADSGKITIGDTDISEIDIKDYRRHLSYVSQDAGVFSGTVREVITYGIDREITDEEIEKAAEMSGISEHIHSLPDGFDTQMSLWGSSLSGGQRQRMVISRELLKDADILIFDEPTSALDAETTRELQETILRVLGGKTIIMVTHDLSFISSVDKIAVIKDGEIEAEGQADELMEKSPLYRELTEERSYKEVFEL